MNHVLREKSDLTKDNFIGYLPITIINRIFDDFKSEDLE